jgi:hypothetical protein
MTMLLEPFFVLACSCLLAAAYLMMMVAFIFQMDPKTGRAIHCSRSN